MTCKHKNMKSTARRDYCPDCDYEFYYGDAHATGEAQISKLINAGDEPEHQEHYSYKGHHELGGEG